MFTEKRIQKYAAENFTGVLHTTLDPEGPGVVRLHMIPPVMKGGVLGSCVVIVNGQDIIPVRPAWAILLAEFIKETNKYEGREISDKDADAIMRKVTSAMRKVYPFISKNVVKRDVYAMMHSFTQIARGQMPDEEVPYMTMGEYAPFMGAPHRMDLMVSAMTKDGKWHCNQQCVHCYAAGQPDAEEKELSTADWKKIIDKCRACCIPQLTFTGGEPTLRGDLVELIDYSRWFVTRLNTNGILLTKDLCKELAQASLDSVQITFYSHEEGVHNLLVGNGRYKETVQGIENALDAGLSVSINTPLCTLNRDYVKTLEFLHGKGVRYVTCSGLITTGNALKEKSERLQLTKEEMTEILKESVSYCFSHGMEISFTSPGWVEKGICDELGIPTASCGACLSNMAVTPGGNVVPCQSWLFEDPLGNMLQDDWNEIWMKEACCIRRNYSAAMLGDCPLRKTKEAGQ